LERQSSMPAMWASLLACSSAIAVRPMMGMRKHLCSSFALIILVVDRPSSRGV
jgi:hypothetical protein